MLAGRLSCVGREATCLPFHVGRDILDAICPALWSCLCIAPEHKSIDKSIQLRRL